MLELVPFRRVGQAEESGETVRIPHTWKQQQHQWFFYPCICWYISLLKQSEANIILYCSPAMFSHGGHLDPVHQPINQDGWGRLGSRKAFGRLRIKDPRVDGWKVWYETDVSEPEEKEIK